MKLKLVLSLALRCAPALLGVLAAVALQASPAANPVLGVRLRVDLGTLLLVGGAALSALWLSAWALAKATRRPLSQALTALERDTARDRRQFLAQLDHELKNPLMALKTELAFLREGTWQAERFAALEDMAAQVDRLGRLVGDLRKLSELQEQELVLEAVRLDELLTEVVETAQDHPGYARRRLHLTLPRTPWPLAAVRGDRGLLGLVFYNLVDNALKFTQPGAEIEVRAMEMGSWCVVEVADNGQGIPAEDLPRVFEPMYRGANARGHAGSGMGLPLVRAIVVRHGGSIGVQSQVGRGTVFTVRLPLLSS